MHTWAILSITEKEHQFLSENCLFMHDMEGHNDKIWGFLFCYLLFLIFIICFTFEKKKEKKESKHFAILLFVILTKGWFVSDKKICLVSIKQNWQAELTFLNNIKCLEWDEEVICQRHWFYLLIHLWLVLSLWKNRVESRVLNFSVFWKVKSHILM